MEYDGPITSIVRALIESKPSYETILSIVEAAERAQRSVADARRERERLRKATYRSRVPGTARDSAGQVENGKLHTSDTHVPGTSGDSAGQKNSPYNPLYNTHSGNTDSLSDTLFPELGEVESPRARESGGEVVSPQPKKRACRIPDDFVPDITVAQEIGLSFDEAADESASFLDYWRAKPTDATKLDWPATWRVWCRNTIKRRRNGNGYNTNGHSVTGRGESILSSVARVVAASGRANWVRSGGGDGELSERRTTGTTDREKAKIIDGDVVGRG